MQVDVIVRLETDSTSASGSCRRHGVGRLRHLLKKELWLQDQVAAKNVDLGRVPSEDNEADPGTKYLERDRSKKCPRAMQDDDLDHLNVTKRDVDSLVSNTRSLCGKLVQFLRYIAIMSENQINACPIFVVSWVSDYKRR